MKPSAHSPQRKQNGSAIVVVLALLGIMLLYVAANVRALHHLGRELKYVEQRQIQRLNPRVAPTNTMPDATAMAPASTTSPR